MSMSEPFLPHPSHDDRTAAAEPGGEGAPLSQSAEEPDLLGGENEPSTPEPDLDEREDPPFRTPQAGDSVDEDELRTDLSD
ncbi:hypothetical protein [Planctomonas psychrotolerans]|uniref:hypothetical protein n=1 Tax=Planctomonas psychrotolerans TaxID=2528712 RepID=UPI0012384118|nr:hypothetical protein [Planctomonas psychrotolerans]